MGEGLRSNVLYHREEDGQPGETNGVVGDLFWWKGAAQPACSLVKTSEGWRGTPGSVSGGREEMCLLYSLRSAFVDPRYHQILPGKDRKQELARRPKGPKPHEVFPVLY
ncbi:hypothetical protein KSP40_PGU011101 [Platanthera guangdongensis]|uniref:Uncharacterized protein n=1 Tax=Platanthera guangdongensis TaxID=2320717 RepID=A0ABR2M667_9ASPA